MMQNNFQPVCSVAISHTYFKQDVCTCLQFSPLHETKRILDRFGFRVRNQVNGFELFANLRGELREYFDYIGKVTSQTWFEFDILCDNEAFTIFTDFPPGWLGQLTYDSQSVVNSPETGKVQLRETLSEHEPNKVQGRLKLYFEDILKYGNGNPVAFIINLQARATQWQYYVVNRNAMMLNNPAINGKTGINFLGPEKVVIPGGEEALLFSSGELLAYTEIVKYRFDLVSYPRPPGTGIKNTGRVIVKGLPVPLPAQYEMVVLNEQKQVVSPMYIYV